MSALLAHTDSAVQAVKDIVSSSDEVAEKGGLRMVAERTGTQVNFELSVVPRPLEPEAATLLDDKVLNASVEQNRVAFTIADQVEE